MVEPIRRNGADVPISVPGRSGARREGVWASEMKRCRCTVHLARAHYDLPQRRGPGEGDHDGRRIRLGGPSGLHAFSHALEKPLCALSPVSRMHACGATRCRADSRGPAAQDVRHPYPSQRATVGSPPGRSPGPPLHPPSSDSALTWALQTDRIGWTIDRREGHARGPSVSRAVGRSANMPFSENHPRAITAKMHKMCRSITPAHHRLLVALGQVTRLLFVVLQPQG